MLKEEKKVPIVGDVNAAAAQIKKKTGREGREKLGPKAPWTHLTGMLMWRELSLYPPWPERNSFIHFTNPAHYCVH